MLASLVALLYFGHLALGSTACNNDNCLRAVLGTRSPLHPVQASSDCSSYFMATLTPATVTYSVTVPVVSTVTSTSTSNALSTTVVTQVLSETDTVFYTSTVLDFTIINAKRDLVDRQMTVLPSRIPTYASACSGSVRYSSACSCLGLTRATTTVPAPSTTTYVTVSQVTTTVVLDTETSVVTSIFSSATTTTISTTVDTTTTSTINCAPGISQQAIVNGGFESGSLPPWTFSNSGDNEGFDPPTSLSLVQSNVHSGLYAAYIHDDSGSMYDEFTLTQVVEVCPGRPYVFTFWAKALQADFCYLQSSISGVQSGDFAYTLTTSYTQFTQQFAGTASGITTVTISLKDTNCFGNFYLDDLLFTASA